MQEIGLEVEEGNGYKEVLQYMEEKMEKAQSGADGWQNSDEEDDYDYGQECSEVFLQRKKPNTYFEELDFKRDPKHGLVYTNTDYMQKQRGVLTHVLKQLGSNLM